MRVRPLGPGAWQVSGPGVVRRFVTLEGARRWASLHLSDCGGGHLAVLDDAGAELEDCEVGPGSLAAVDRPGVSAGQERVQRTGMPSWMTGS
jgi:hypothetical protein